MGTPTLTRMLHEKTPHLVGFYRGGSSGAAPGFAQCYFHSAILGASTCALLRFTNPRLVFFTEVKYTS